MLADIVLKYKKINSKAKDAAQHAVTSFFHRIVPKLMLNPATKIVDSLEDTARYIAAEVEFVYNLAKSNQTTCPFQLDACIAYNYVKTEEVMEKAPTAADADDVDDDDFDSDEDDDDTKDDGPFVDFLGNIKNKLKSEKCLHEIAVLDAKERNVRAYKLQFEKFKDVIKTKYKGKEGDEYPRNHRLISLIDRRKPKDDNGTVDSDEIYFYEPPSNCNTMPTEQNDKIVPLWYFDASKTSIIPHIGYNEAMNSKDPTKHISKVVNKQNINSSLACKGSLLVLSFHVEAINEIRAYLYLNGQITRFFPEDITGLLPRFFVDSKENRKFAKGDAAQTMVEAMKPKLRDLKFEAFYNAYKYKKK